MCEAYVSSGSTTAATPPCAQFVLLSTDSFFVTIADAAERQPREGHT